MTALPPSHPADDRSRRAAPAGLWLVARALAAALSLLVTVRPPAAAAQAPTPQPVAQPPTPSNSVELQAPKPDAPRGDKSLFLPLHPPRRHNILIIGSYDKPATSSQLQMNEIQDAIVLAYPQSKVHADFIVPSELAGRPISDALLQKFADSFRSRFASSRPELLIVVDTLAFRVLTENAPDLFPETRTVFSGVVHARIKPGALSVRPTTGVFEEIDTAGTLDLMLHLQPELKRVLVVAQGTENADRLRHVAERQLASHEGFARIDWARSTRLDALRREISSLGPDSAAIVIAFLDPEVPPNQDGVFNKPWDLPVYTVYSSNINQDPQPFSTEDLGAVGGHVVSYPLLGRVAGGLAVRVLRGEDPRSIPPIDRAGLTTVVDYRQLRRLGIPVRHIPSGATVINGPSTYLGRMWPYFLVGALVILAEGAIIGALIRGQLRLRRVQASLDRERERYKLAVSSATESVWDWDVVKDFTVWAGPLADSLGFGGSRSPERPESPTWSERLHPDDQERVRLALDRHLKSDEPYEIEYRLRMPTGEHRWFASRGRCRRDRDGRPVRMTGTLTDVTDRVEAERQLAQSEERFRAVFEKHPFPMWIYDRATLRFLAVNDAAVRKYGFSRAEFAEMTLHDLRAPSERPRLTEFFTESDPSADYTGNWKHRTADGREIDVLVSTCRVPWLPDRTTRLGAFVDITEKVWAEKLREHQNHALRLIASDAPIDEVLREIVRSVQRHDPSTIGSVILLDADGRSMRAAAAPDLPEELAQSVNGMVIGPSVGSCGTAMFRKSRVIVSDIAVDPLWEGGRDLALRNGVRACWSEPILDGHGQVLGSFAMYYREARSPQEWELSLIATSARLAGLAIERRRLESDLRDTEARFRALFEQSAVGIVQVSPDGRFMMVNRRACEIFGRDADDLIGRTFSEVTHPDDIQRNLDLLHESRDSAEGYELDKRYVRPDGTVVWASVKVRIVRKPGGEIDYIISAILDVTERREADQALRQSESTNRALLAAMPDLLFGVDASGRYLYYKGPPNASLIVEPKDFLGRTMTEVLPRDMAETAMRALTDAIASGGVQVYEYQTQRDGRLRWWEGRVVPASPGEALILVRDITSRREAEEALRDSQRRLSLLINQAPIGVIVWNTRFEILQWNPTAQRMFGFSAQEAVGRHGDLIVPPESRAAVAGVWRDLMAQRGGMYSVNDNITRSGGRIICEWNNTPLVGADGAVIGVSSFVQDVTERVLSERRQALMMQELDHRVKNNMAAVLSLAEQTGRATQDFQEFQATFMGRVRALARMHHILAAGRWHGADLRTLVGRVVEPYAGSESDRLNADGPEVSLHPRAAQSMAMTLNELATNAAKHGALSCPGGRVVIRWATELHDGRPVVLLRWSERDGPPTSPPTRRGLGIDLIEGAIIYQLGGKVEFQFPPEGLECSLSAPIGADEDQSHHHPARGPVSDNKTPM